MKAVWAWIHEDGAGREQVLEELCPGWSILSSRIASEEALMVAFDALVAERNDREAQVAKRRLSPAQSRKIARDVARVSFRNRQFRLGLAVLLWPPGWSHTRLEDERAT